MAEITVFYEGPIVTREAGLAAGLKRFFTGVPCDKGHLAQRLTFNGRCKICTNDAWNRWYIRKRARPRSVTTEVTIVYSGPIVSWRDAKARDLRRYFTGKPCKYGHVDQRTFPKCTCLTCLRIIGKTEKWKESHKKSAAKRRRTPEAKAKHVVSHARHRKTEKFKIGNRIRSHSRRALTLQAKGSFTREDERRLRELQRRCYLCGKPFTKANPGTLDHVIPLSRGGNHDAGNIALAHKSCNCRKHATRTHLI